jgi:hypothetical protein
MIALEPHLASVIVAGAQAVYLRSGDSDLSLTVAPYTTDGDLALDPSGLGDDPTLESAMTWAGFALSSQSEDHVAPGIWVAATIVEGERFEIPIDLIVPEGVAPSGGRRGARLNAHGNRAARRAVGLEAVLIDHDPMEIAALEPGDTRTVVVNVAGVAGLLVAKLHKIHDRAASGRSDRLNDKDAGDVIRLMQAESAYAIAARLEALRMNSMSGSVTATSLEYLDELFGRPGRIGITMATEALRVAMPGDEIEAIALAYTAALLAALKD